MTLVPLYLILPMIGLSAGGVLHHREHAASKERGLANNLPGNNHHRPTIPHGGSGHGALENYVGGITPRPYDRQGEEKLRVIKITRTYAIPYPVPVPLAKVPHQGPAPWSSTNLGHGNGGASSGYHGPAGSGYHGSTGSGYHGSTDIGFHGSTDSGFHGPTGSGYHGSTSSGYHSPTGIADHLHGFPLGGGDLSHNSLEYTGPSELFSGHGSDSGHHGYSGGNHGYSGVNQGYSGGNHGYSGGNHGYSGGNHGYSGGNQGTGGNHYSLQDDVYQRHGYSTSKPFRPSQEYTPPELNDHSYSHDNQW